MKHQTQADDTNLSEHELTEARGGYPAGPGPHPPEDPTGKPLPQLPKPRGTTPRGWTATGTTATGKTPPGQTPPIYVFPEA